MFKSKVENIFADWKIMHYIIYYNYTRVTLKIANIFFLKCSMNLNNYKCGVIVSINVTTFSNVKMLEELPL